MRPRLMIRTHYQAAEPRVLIAAITQCTTPTVSRDEQVVARTLVSWARLVGRTLSLPGAIYALGNSRTLGLLSRTNRWTAAGLGFGYIHSRSPTHDDWEPELSFSERYLFLKRYLIGGGALIIKFGAWLLQQGRTTHEQIRDSSLLERLYTDILNDYLQLATQIRDRTAIRQQRDRLARIRYSALTKRHKRYPLLAAMRRLDLLNQAKGEFTPDGRGQLQRLVGAVPDVRTLERLVQDRRVHAAVLHVLGEVRVEDYSAPVDATLASAYRYALNTGLQLCPLEFLEDMLCAVSAGQRVPSTADSAEQCLDRWRHRFPGQVRFHVDRRGRRAFVTVTDSLLRRMNVN